MSAPLPTHGSYSLTVDNAFVLDAAGDCRQFASLEDARHAARLRCGATIVQWRRTRGNGRVSSVVEQVPAPAMVPIPGGRLDFTVAPGRYLVWEDLSKFCEMCAARGLTVSAAYALSGLSMMRTAQEGHRSYELRDFGATGHRWFTVRQH